MRVLLVGAGAVGQVYGYYLQKAGWDVSFLVKEKYAMSMRKGLTLYPLNRPSPWEPRNFHGYGTLFEPSEVRKNRWDQVWFCVSSTALDGEWLEPLLAAIGDATLVSLQPGMEDQRRLADRVGADRLVSGLIGFRRIRPPSLESRWSAWGWLSISPLWSPRFLEVRKNPFAPL